MSSLCTVNSRFVALPVSWNGSFLMDSSLRLGPFSVQFLTRGYSPLLRVRQGLEQES
jgi:hypothetical protein